MMGAFVQDLRFALRILLRSRVFAATAIAALALGIGATSAIFSVLYGVLLKPLPYRDPGRLVRVFQSNPVERFKAFPLSPADYLDYRKQNRVFSDIATYVRQDQQFGGVRPERLIGLRVSYNYFRVFGERPLIGREFIAAEEHSSGGTDVAIVSYDVWKRLLDGDPHAIGKTIRLSDSVFHVVGVMPQGFGDDTQVWLPFDMLGNPRGVPRAFHYCKTVARLKPGISIERAQADLNLIAAHLEAQYPDDRNWRTEIKPLQDDITGEARPTLLVIAGAVAFVLLIACVNVANLLLAQGAIREREMAIRTAIGASRARLLRQLLTESLTLASVGGALGLLLAWWGVHALVSIGPTELPRLHDISLNGWLVAGTAGVSMLCGLVFGITPALAASAKIQRSRPRGLFVIAEVALTFVLLIGAGLLLRTFVALTSQEAGFNPRGVLTMSTALSYPRLAGARRYANFYERFVEALANIPGVSAAGATSNLPWSGGVNRALFGIQGRPRPAGMSMHATYQSISPDYLHTIGVPLLAGRWLTAADNFDSPKVLLINKAFALQYWPNFKAAIGRQIYTMRDVNTPEPAMTIVGVVGDIKAAPTDAQPEPTFFTPILQSPTFGNYVVLRSAESPETLVPAVQVVARQMGDDLTVQDVRPMEKVIASAIGPQRFAVQTMSLFAGIALALTLIGIYGVMSYTANRRSREFAIRSALGATPRDTVALLLRQGAMLMAIGIVGGGGASAALTRALKSILYQVAPSDPPTFVAAAIIVAAVATVASLAPARRLLSRDPIQELRHE